jgi:hypothetical protein
MDRAHGHQATIAWMLKEIHRRAEEDLFRGAPKAEPPPAASVELSLQPGLGLVVGAETPREAAAKRCDNRQR